MAKHDQPVFQGHHVIEQDAYGRSSLLQELKKKGLFDLHADRNLLNLPADRQLAFKLEVGPHNGGPLGQYSDGLSNELSYLQESPDGQAALANNRRAAERVAKQVDRLCDTLKVAMVNGDLLTNTPQGMTPEAANAKNMRLFEDLVGYEQTHTRQIDAVGKLKGSELRWPAALKSEATFTASVEAIERPGFKPVKGNAALGQQTLVDAVENAQAGGRLRLSEVGEASVDAIRVPRGQGGFIAPELLGSNLPAGARVMGAAGVAFVAYEFGTSGHKWVQLHSQGNQAGADSTAAHFVGSNLGGAMGGFVAGAGAGALTGSWTGPGVLVASIGGGVIGAYMGERWAEQKDLDRIYKQTDPVGRTWMQDPQGRWLRGAHQQQVQTSALAGEVEVRPVQTALGEDVLFRADYVATGRLERLLNHKAANASYELGLDKPPPPQSPFRLDASTEPLPARTPDETGRAFVRHPQSGQWQLEIAQVLDGRIPSMRHEAVSAERALELDQHARTVIAQNAANSPAAMASRYRVAYEQGRWSDFDPALPPAISNALERSDTLRASDGNTYTRLADDQWVSSGVIYNSTANLNLRDELELTWQSQRAGMQEMNTLADHAKANPQLQPEGVRGQLASLYAKNGIERSAAQLDAAVAAVERNHVRDEVLADFTLELMPDPRTRAPSADSAIASFSDGGGNRMLLKSTTTVDEIAQVQAHAAGRPETPLPDSPELRIATLSPQEREAHQQALREGNREGASAQEAQQAASVAAVNVHGPHADDTRAARSFAQTQPPLQRDVLPATPQARQTAATTSAHSPEPPTPQHNRPDATQRHTPEDQRPREPAVPTYPAAEAAKHSAPDPQPAQQAPVTPMQPGHPDHALYQQIREQVTALDARHGRSFDETSERMTASLLVLAKHNGLDRVDHVLLSNATAEKQAAHYVFVVQGEPGNPAHQRGAMPTAQAAQTSVEESMQKFEVVSQEQQQRTQAQQLEQQLKDTREQQGSQARAIG